MLFLECWLASPATACSKSVNFGRMSKLSNCAHACKYNFTGFMFGRQGAPVCGDGTCGCRCVNLATCIRSGHLSWNLYEMGEPASGKLC